MDAPLSLQLAVNSPPKTSIKTSGATVVMTAIVKVMVLPPGQPPVQLSSMTMETKFNAKVSIRKKRLAVHADLRRFKIFSNQSALESLALIPLQAPLKTMLQMSVVPLINNWTKRGVRIPLADGMDFKEEVVEYHNVAGSWSPCERQGTPWTGRKSIAGPHSDKQPFTPRAPWNIFFMW
ncbi:phospholipid transfer protein-like isoform X1 [Kryptolebias marmoratus]|uniref:phospholipid transfer protein-like isoform X1 n=1 Tax=Kryptolebias marmoratus TaxID=37003 RepID=UPI000D5310B7|nr:phospholipid transfer protein-like isoform X1 [Kryptolebias marmoratus]